MKYRKQLLTACSGLALACASLFAHAGNDEARVWVVFKDGHKGSVQRALQGNDAKFHHSFDNMNAFAVSVPQQALNGLRNNPNVVYIEEDVKRFPLAQTAPYGIAMVQADDLSLQPPSANRKVCIIDSGYDLGHEDLPTNNVNGTNDSGTGNWYTDENSHGTHVAGTIAAVDNALGVVGVFRNENVNIHIIKVFDADGWAYSSSLVDAAMRCEDAGANVISMSLGGSFKSTTEDKYFSDANGRGVLSIAAAGNDGSTKYSYPASYSAVMSVAAIDSSKTVASFSQKNDQVEIAAPGVGVRSTVPMGTGSEASVSVGTQGFEGIGMDGSPTGSASGPLVDCGLGTSACPGGGGQVCLIQRGDITFADKVLACQDGGGVAAVIYNNESGSLSGTLGETATSIPSLGVSDTQGAELLNLLGQTADVVVGAGNYAYFDGTSMATPHVSAVAALVWSNHTSCTNDEVRNALNTTAEDLGAAGRDTSYGYGLIQASAATDYLASQSCGGGTGNNPPTASFTFSCTDLACDFDGSGSSDSDGSISGYSWDFGDGNTASGAFVSHTFAADGDYTVTLTVTDDAGASDTDSQTVSVSSGGGDPGGDITLSAVGYKVKGRHHIDLSWSGATSTNVDIYRNGSKIVTTANDGAYTDATDNRGWGNYTYEVCEEGTSTCSNSVTVIF